ncbi:MAG: formylglycine-generating enzyme family protein, partial [Planctomycetes bacterium]|nr:formylglycine-generating enzyme family protein [Planctomycetota bacterium]
FRLVPEEGTVRIASNAAGAEVFDASGARLGATGATLSLSPFMAHELTVKAARHKPAEVTVRIDRPGLDAGTRQVVLEQQRTPPDLVEVANAQYASLDGLATGSREAQDRQRRAVSELGLPLEVKTARTGILFRLIPAGSFTMGSPRAEQDMVVKAGVDRKVVEDETQHQVTLTKPFYCGKYEVTQGQWEMVCGSNPSYFKNAGRDAPVENVIWEECQTFLQKLCQMEGVAEGTYRLLTEAQWEYACRAGSTSAYRFGDSDSGLGEYAWYDRNSGATTHPVGQKRPNGWGLHDMHGNVWEWCQDWYGEYASGSVPDPLGPASGVDRVSRGGSWFHDARFCRSADRSRIPPGDRYISLGFRLARTTASYP